MSDDRSEGWGRGGPQQLRGSVVVAVWWPLREAELLQLELSSAHVAADGSAAELRLGATKADTRGRGSRRVRLSEPLI